MEKRYDILALGEVMLRLSPSGENRLVTGKRGRNERSNRCLFAWHENCSAE